MWYQAIKTSIKQPQGEQEELFQFENDKKMELIQSSMAKRLIAPTDLKANWYTYNRLCKINHKLLSPS